MIGINIDLALLEAFPQCPVVLRSRIDEALSVNQWLTAVAGHNRKVQLGQAVHNSASDTRNADDRPDPVVLSVLMINVLDPTGLLRAI